MRQDLSKRLYEGWTEKTNEKGQTFYMNEYTLETSCQQPFMPAQYFWIDRNDEVECYHLMVKHAGSRVPSSWRQPIITRTKAEAIALIKKYLAVILSKRKTFQQMARVFSDCPSAKFNGHLGVFRQGTMRRRFAIMLNNMAVGGISHPIETPSGIHLLMRTR